jgi:hypothetical protein
MRVFVFAKTKLFPQVESLQIVFAKTIIFGPAAPQSLS